MKSTSLRGLVYRRLEPPPGSRGIDRAVTMLIVCLVLLSVLSNILSSVDGFNTRYGPWLDRLELVFVILFSVEYLLRVWSCVEHENVRYRSALAGRLRFALTPMMLIDLLAILPYYLGAWISIDLLFLRVFRLLRIFKLTRYSPAMNMLMTVLRREADAFGAAMFILGIILVFSASGIYLFEHDVQPDAFGSIPAAMWWAVATLTTVGYGDVTPITPMGKVFGASITIVGVGMVALPAGILASAFSEELRKRREAFMARANAAMQDGQLNAKEHKALESARQSLGLDADEAAQMLKHLEQGSSAQRLCPHCGKSLETRDTRADGIPPDRS